MPKATAALVKRELDHLNDLEIARIIALGATEAEVLEACAWLDTDEQAIRRLAEPTSAVVEEILAIARAAADADDEPDPVLG